MYSDSAISRSQQKKLNQPLYQNLLINFKQKNKNLALIKLKTYTNEKVNVAKMLISVFDRLENIVGKGKTY